MSELGPSKEHKLASQQIADRLRALGEEHGFDKETCDEIAGLPPDEAYEAAYGLIMQAGLDPDELIADPDEVLADFKEPRE